MKDDVLIIWGVGSVCTTIINWRMHMKQSVRNQENLLMLINVVNLCAARKADVTSSYSFGQ